MRVGIVAKHNSDRAVEVTGEIARGLEAAGETVVVDETTRTALADHVCEGPDRLPASVSLDELADCSLAVSVGGDGTFLYAARGAATTPLLGVNVGEVGFLNAVHPTDAVETTLATVDHLREADSPAVVTFPRIVATGPDWTLEPAVNDVVVHGPRRGHGGGLDVTVEVDGKCYTAGRADGVLVATPAGSTAYNLSEGGPLVHHDVDGLVITDMAGDGLRPPLVVDADSEVSVDVANASSGVVVGDGRIRRSIDPPTTVTVRRDEIPLRIAEPSLEFFSALEKLD